MTRMWTGIMPIEMCDQHLLGEHKELHQEIGTLLNHPHGQAITEGHVREGQVILSEIERRHQIVVREMLSRGMNHDSPMDIPEEITENELWGINNANKKENREDLFDRCEECGL